MGLEIDYSDPCWSKWEDEKLKFYQQNQRRGIGAVVNDAGYKVMKGSIWKANEFSKLELETFDTTNFGMERPRSIFWQTFMTE